MITKNQDTLSVAVNAVPPQPKLYEHVFAVMGLPWMPVLSLIFPSER